jgi:hypothetical protein
MTTLIPGAAALRDLPDFHTNIHKKLGIFIKNRKIPNIIFYGPHGSGKQYILNRFIQSIYDGDKTAIKNYVMRANCAHGKGIRFIREELKFFAKTNIDFKEGAVFKSVILTNADKLTIDAQSALRRCIELFSSSTRFFIVVENKDSLLKPILSRFCDIYIPPPVIRDAAAAEDNDETAITPPMQYHTAVHPVNLHTFFANHACETYKIIKSRDFQLREVIQPHSSYMKCAEAAAGTETQEPDDDDTMPSIPTSEEYAKILKLSVSLYEQGYSALDIIDFIHTFPNMIELKRYELLIMFDKVRKEFRNEKLLMLYMLHFIVFRCRMSLENISFM